MTRSRLLLAGVVAVFVVPAAFFAGSEIFSPGAQAGTSEIVVLRGQGEIVPVIGDGSSIITVVERTEDAKAAVGESTRAFLVTEGGVREIDAAWVRAEMQRGLVLGGINLTTTDLRQAFDIAKPVTLPNGEVVESAGVEADFDPAGQAYFTLLYEVERDDGGGSRGGVTGLLSSDDALLRQIERMEKAANTQTD